MPIVVGALGTIPKGLVGHLESLGVNLDVSQIHKTALSGRILKENPPTGSRLLRTQDVTCTGNWLAVEH